MIPVFNLLDEPWLPVRFVDGSSARLGLLDTFRRSGEIAALADTTPPNLVAQYRLLLAILHRALSRAFPEGWRDKDRARWYDEGLPVEKICDYLEHWRERFWLFHSQYPFMQVAALGPFMREEAVKTGDDKYKPKPWTQIALDRTTGNNSVLFDHSLDGTPYSIEPAYAINTLLGFLQFKPGGTVKILRDSDKGCALTNTAAIIPVGTTLAQTLALNLHEASGQGASDDLPAWERSPLMLPDLRGGGRSATGYNDLYTRQSRAVLFLREESVTGLSIRQLYFAEGCALIKEGGLPDPMANYSSGKPLGFKKGRAVWRDLPSLLPDPVGSQPAVTLNLAAEIYERGNVDIRDKCIMVAGVASEPGRDKLLTWRIEHFILPTSLLKDKGKVRQLRERLGDLESLYEALEELAINTMAEVLVDTKNSDKTCKFALANSQFATCFFSNSERNLPSLMRLLADGQVEEALISWGHVLCRSAEAAWHQLLINLGGAPRALRADAKSQDAFHRILKKYTPLKES